MPEPPNLMRNVRRFGWALLIVAIVLGVWGEVSRVVARNALGKETADSALPTVITVTAQPTSSGEDLVLPGSVQAYIEAPIYARTSGYLKKWYTDIGTQVVTGQRHDCVVSVVVPHQAIGGRIL